MKALASNRVVIEDVYPEIDCGRFAAKRVAGDALQIFADIYCDGHDQVDACVRYRRVSNERWSEAPMHLVDNDRWMGALSLPEIGRYEYTVLAWRNRFRTWQSDVLKKRKAGQTVTLEIAEAVHLVEEAIAVAPRREKLALERLAEAVKSERSGAEERLALLLAEETATLMSRAGPRTNCSKYERVLEVVVDLPVAAFAAWYELFPRSQSGDEMRHGTFDDVIRKLPYVRDLGFDVLYFTPIHPIGRINRKGRNNALTTEEGDPGSVYAIGSEEGGHDSIHPELGDFDDFARLVDAAREHGLEIALDIAIQCAPDHPWIREHPEWFDWRPDGTIKFAENPPKKYEDIVSLHFYRDALPSLWYALREVFLFWIDKGVKIFRVDNPHTKPVPFWEWVIGEVKERHPDTVFLSEAFTRPKMMKRLAKAGFTQSYSYFTWRNTKHELTGYLTELTQTECAEYMRPNFFVNTPDINPFYLQANGRAGFRIRLALAALLSPLYGIYNGFELCEAAAVPGKEEYLDSEKYQLRAWDWDRPGHIKDDIRILNRIRKNQDAFREFRNLRFYNFFNDDVLYFGKLGTDGSIVLVLVTLDARTPQGGEFEVPLWEFGLPDAGSVEVHDLVEGHRFRWNGKIQSYTLDPAYRPYSIWRISASGVAA